MPTTLDKHLDLLVKHGHANLLTQLNHGIEKEGLRVDPRGHIAQTNHPKALGSALTHSEITTDYSEALLEFITPVCDSTESVLEHLRTLHRYCFSHLGDEQLWNASMPCHIDRDADIRIAEYGSSNIGTMKHVYRIGLQHRYGKMMQTIAGIHYNFSLPEAFWPAYQELRNMPGELSAFQSAGYFKLIRSFRRFSWLPLYLFGASPALSSAFMQGKAHKLETLDSDTLYLPYATSLRMSDLGYTNKAQSALNICFNQLDSYADSLNQAIHTPNSDYARMGVKVDGHYNQLNTNILQIENEYYSDIRPKRVIRSGEKPVQALKDRGVQYIEVRNTDINPLLDIGISLEQANFMDAFLVTCQLCSDGFINDEECRRISHNVSNIVTQGRKPDLMLAGPEGECSVNELGKLILGYVRETAQVMDEATGTHKYIAAVDAQLAKLEDVSLTPSAQVLKAIRESGLSYQEWTLEQSRMHRENLMREPLPSEIIAKYDDKALSSIEEQLRIEASDSEDFDTFLARYMAS